MHVYHLFIEVITGAEMWKCLDTYTYCVGSWIASEVISPSQLVARDSPLARGFHPLQVVVSLNHV